MKQTTTMIVIASLIAIAGLTAPAAAAPKEITLLKPSTTGGMPLMTALGRRQSSRSFAARALPPQVLSNLLWAACGVNRPGGKRTAPTAMNKQEIEVYVALAEGLYRYDAKKHVLEVVLERDIRALTGKQGFVKDAPVNIIYVADLSRTAGDGREDKVLYASADTGFMGQNVYLFCAAEGLATVIRGHMDKAALAKAMNLKADRLIILAQTVGYPGN